MLFFNEFVDATLCCDSGIWIFFIIILVTDIADTDALVVTVVVLKVHSYTLLEFALGNTISEV